MLLELSVKHLAVIEEVRVSFRTGFHVFTGETGAGKSILIDALSLAIGGRASADLVRHGCDKAEIEALFDVPGNHPARDILRDNGIEGPEDEPIIVRREVTAAGKSTARVNGQLVTIVALRSIGETLVNIHGQHEHQSLLRADRHLEWLDAFGGGGIAPAKAAYRSVYDEYAETKRQLEQVSRSGKEALQMADLYRFQWEEIDAAKVKPGEDESLQEERQRLANSERLFAAANDAFEALYGGKRGLDSVTRAVQRMSDISKYDPDSLQPLVEQMQSAFYQLEDAAFQIRDYREKIEFNPDKLERIEQRLQTLHSLKRKYGDSAEDILAYAAKIKKELDDVDNQEERIAELSARLGDLTATLRTRAEALTRARRAAAETLSRKLMEHLKDLHMEKTRFEVELRSNEGAFRPDGWDTAEFLIAPNPGEPLRGLAKIASGGELSRIMLAMKSIFAAVDRVPSLIFDEVDTGVSGRAAQAIAEKMARLAGQVQVFAITHLPQVACMADAHYAIEKKVKGERTFTEVNALGAGERTAELARMLGGVEVTDTTMRHAQEMLALADSRKSGWM
ncbi:DNA repair protein RecN [Paenibacillus sp.]|uniref:DNA repair protein RecN n=1 Tax=Paenibacillus sp. TaxID=58172 RepID=UPI0028115DE9|nr:DNA repair protein RecN [Paenibacillus sp.]